MLRKMAARMMSKRRLSLALVAALIPTSAMATMVVNFGVAGGSIFKVNGAVGKNYTLPTDGVTVTHDISYGNGNPMAATDMKSEVLLVNDANLAVANINIQTPGPGTTLYLSAVNPALNTTGVTVGNSLFVEVWCYGYYRWSPTSSWIQDKPEFLDGTFF